MNSLPVQGTQVVSRVAALLRIVGRKPEGSPLVELVRVSGLTRPTVHRQLSSLAAEGLLDQDPGSNWVLGPEILLMGSVASARFPLEVIARPSLRRLAEESGESAFSPIRRGAETVCLLGEEGSFPVRSFVLHEGVRFSLGVASAGTAIMAFLPAEEQEELLAGWAAHAGSFASTHTEALVRGLGGVDTLLAVAGTENQVPEGVEERDGGRRLSGEVRPDVVVHVSRLRSPPRSPPPVTSTTCRRG